MSKQATWPGCGNVVAGSTGLSMDVAMLRRVKSIVADEVNIHLATLAVHDLAPLSESFGFGKAALKRHIVVVTTKAKQAVTNAWKHFSFDML